MKNQKKNKPTLPQNIGWMPLPGSQTFFLSCPFLECLYCGTRGPGKTEALLMDFAQHCDSGFGSAWTGIIFREEYKQLNDVVQKSKRLFKKVFGNQAHFLGSQGDYKWVWATGEELLFRVFKNADTYWDYHGHEYPWIGWEELTNWPNLDGYEAMKSCCRSSTPNMPRKIRATANPYGVGHNAVKKYFIDPAPFGIPITNPQGQTRVALHGSIYENTILMKNDPDYIKNLESLTDENKKKAWLFGSWEITAGGMFDDLWDLKTHVIKPFKIPKTWYVDRSFDWGSSKPFSIGWWAESNGEEFFDAFGNLRWVPKGTKFRIAEWYGCGEKTNEGLRLSPSQIADGIKEREKTFTVLKDLEVRPGPADSSIFAKDRGNDEDSIAEIMSAAGVEWAKASKGQGSIKNGVEVIRERLVAGTKHPMEAPGLFIFDTCRDFIRVFPVIPKSKKDPDVYDTDAEDHPVDETRYELTTIVGMDSSEPIE